MNFERSEDLIREGWDRQQVGIWYGAWSADDWRAASGKQNPADKLSTVASQRALGWVVPKSFADTVRRFAAISNSDWVFAYFDGELHFARLAGELRSNPEHPLNRKAEIFKYRNVTDKKSFRVRNLPDCFRLLPSAGRGNIHEIHGTNQRLVQSLAASCALYRNVMQDAHRTAGATAIKRSGRG
jgi:hypothetical protein